MSKKRQIILISVFFAVLAIILAVFLIYPIFLEIKNNSAELINIKTDLVQPNDSLHGVSKLQKEYQLVEPDFNKIKSFFIDPNAPVDFIKFLETIAKDSSVSIKISPITMEASETDPWKFLSYQISSNGSYDNIMEFLERVENSNYLIKIQNLELRKAAIADSGLPLQRKAVLGDMSLNLTIKVFSNEN